MSEILEATLVLSIDAFVASLQQAAQTVQAFAQAISGSLGSTAQVFQQQVQQINQVAQVTRQASETIRNAKRTETAEINESARQASDFFREMEAEKQAIFRQTLERELLDNKLKVQDENATSAAMLAVQKSFFAVTQGLAKERVAIEKASAAEVLAVWAAAGKELEAIQETAQARATLRANVTNTLAAQGAARITGQTPAQGIGGVTLANELFLLQGWVNILEKATPAAGLFEQAMTRVGTSFRTLAGYAAAGFLIALPFKLIEMAKEAAQTAMKMELLNNTFIAIGGSAAAGARTMEFLRSTAQRVGVDLLSTADSFRGLQAAAAGTELEGGKINKIFEQMTAVSRVVGMDAGQLQRSFLALEQMISKGTITSEELRKQLGNALPGALNIMAQSLGVTTRELNEMMKAGDLISVDVLPRFMNQVEQNFGPGLEKAANSAAATFARFGNNALDVSKAVGDKILTVLKPIMDVINAAAEMLRKHDEATRAARESKVGAAPERPDSIATAGGAALQKDIDQAFQDIIDKQNQVIRLENLLKRNLYGPEQMQRIQERVTEEKANLELLRDAYKDVLERRKNFLAEQQGTGVIGGEPGAAPFARQTKEATEELKKLDTQLNRIDMQKKIAPELFKTLDAQLDIAKDKLSETTKAFENFSEVWGGAKAARERGLPADAQAKADELRTKMGSAQAEVDRIEKIMEKEREKEREDKRIENERLATAKRDAAERIRITQDLNEEIALIGTGTAAREIERMQLVLANARRLKVDETLVTEYESLKRRQIAQDEARRVLDEQNRVSAERRANAEKEAALIRDVTIVEVQSTKTRLDNWDAMLAEKRRKLEDAIDKELNVETINIPLLNKLEADGAAGRTRIIQEENDKLLKEQAKGWRELATTIENTLAGAFESILKGSKNVFEGIRDAFLKLLAKLAADALTHAIIIPAIVQFLGSGGGSEGASSGSIFAGSGLGAGGTGGGTGGNGAGGILGAATGLAGAGLQGYQIATGGSFFGAGTFGGGLAATELGSIGAEGAGIGSTYIGQSTLMGEIGLGSTTVGTAIGGIGAGIAAGMILSQINSMIGLHGTLNTTLAGAGGGALAGTIIMPGIGTAIGAIVGAIGGALAGILGKGGKEPAFKIQDVQAGEISYDDQLGIIVKRDFKILKDFHEKLGTDYEEFIKLVNDAINESFHQVVSQLHSAEPEVARALIDPMNTIFQDVAILIRDYPKIGGEKFKEQLTVMLGTDIPKIFADAANHGIEEFTKAVEKVSPVVKAFSQIIDAVLQDIAELQRQQKALNDTLNGSLKNLSESLMSPAQLFSQRQAQYADLLSQFNAGDEATKIQLAPQIAQLAEAILELSKNVLTPTTSFGDLTGIQGAIKQLQESLYTPVQTMAARQSDLANLLDQFRHGDTGVRTILTPQITQLALQIMELAKGVNVLSEQLTLMQDFPAQLRAITEALYSPAQSYLSQRSQLTALIAQFKAASPEDQLKLEPQIAQLASTILQLAKSQDVLGQDPQLLRQTQAELLSAVTDVQNIIASQASQGQSDSAMLQATLERTQVEMVGVLREVEYTMAGSIVNAGQQTITALWQTAGQIVGTTYTMSAGIINAQYTTANGVVSAQYDSAGHLLNTQYAVGGWLVGSINNVAATDAAWSNWQVNLQTQLINQVAWVREAAWYSYTQMMNALWTEVGLAQEQIRLLVNSLYHLETVDQVVRDALGVLGAMNARLGNPLKVNMEGSLAEQLNRDLLTTTQQLLNSQRGGNAATIAMLGKIAFGLTFEQGYGIGLQYTGYQHGTRSVPFNMMAMLHRGEQVVPEWDSRGGGGRVIQIQVYGGSKDAGQIADEVIKRIETKSGRLQSTSIQTTRR